MKTHLVALLLLMPLTACTLASTASDFHGLRDVDGSIPTHINSTHYAVQLFIFLPFIGDASLKTAVSKFAKQADELGGTRVRNRAVGHHAAMVDSSSAVLYLH